MNKREMFQHASEQALAQEERAVDQNLKDHDRRLKIQKQKQIETTIRELREKAK